MENQQLIISTDELVKKQRKPRADKGKQRKPYSTRTKKVVEG